MIKPSSPEELAEDIVSNNEIHRGFILGIDGIDGSGKSTLAEIIAPLLDARLINIDEEFLEKRQDTYVDAVRKVPLIKAIKECEQLIAIEGVCLLAVLKSVNIALSRLIYVKRVNSYNNWHDREECSPSDDVEQFIQLKGTELTRFIRLKDPTDKVKSEIPPLTNEIIRYHWEYDPASIADYTFRRKS